MFTFARGEPISPTFHPSKNHRVFAALVVNFHLFKYHHAQKSSRPREPGAIPLNTVPAKWSGRAGLRGRDPVRLLRLGDHLEPTVAFHGNRRAPHGEQHRVQTADMDKGDDGEEDGHVGSGRVLVSSVLIGPRAKRLKKTSWGRFPSRDPGSDPVPALVARANLAPDTIGQPMSDAAS